MFNTIIDYNIILYYLVSNNNSWITDTLRAERVRFKNDIRRTITYAINTSYYAIEFGLRFGLQAQ